MPPTQPHRTQIIAEARRWLGTPYQHQASLKGVGCDCLGLVRGVWREIYGGEPEQPGPYSPDWAETRRTETLALAAGRHMLPVAPEDVAPGDLLLFRWRSHLPAKHAAIVATGTTMIHAHDGATVCEVPITGWWRRHIAFAFAFPEPEEKT